jgi:hypothetical protein
MNNQTGNMGNLAQSQNVSPQPKKSKAFLWIFLILFLIGLGLGGYYSMMIRQRNQAGKDTASDEYSGVPPQQEVIEKGVNTVDVSGEMSSDENTISLQSVEITNPGFILIRRDQQGTPDEIIGVSDFLPAGVSDNVVIKLTGEVTQGEILYAMVYADNTADGKFTPNGDEPSKDPDGNLAIYSFFAGGQPPEVE